MTTAAVVLAAGAGTRFAGPTAKLLAPVHGRPLVAHAIEHALAARLDDTIVVTGAVALDGIAPARARLVHNERWADGQATSLQVAIVAAGAAGHDVVVVALGDQPGVVPEAWRLVAATVATPIAVAVYDGRRGHPVRLHHEVWPLLPTTGDTGAKTVMAGRPDLVTEVACPGDPVDVDTVEDLSRWS